MTVVYCLNRAAQKSAKFWRFWQNNYVCIFW